MQLDDSAPARSGGEAKHHGQEEPAPTRSQAEKDYEIQIKDNESRSPGPDSTDCWPRSSSTSSPALESTRASIRSRPSPACPPRSSRTATYRQELDDLTGQISLAKSTVEQNGERAAWADRMVKLSYMSAAQAQAEKSRLDSSMETLRSLESKKALLISHDRRQQITDPDQQARQRPVGPRSGQVGSGGQARSRHVPTKETATSIYLQAFENLEDIKQQRKECKIVAPDDIIDGSMVVYFKNESNRFSSNNTGLIEQGAQVKEGQKMLRIPNLDRMQVNTKVHEAMVARIHGDVRVPTHLVEFVQAVHGREFRPDRPHHRRPTRCRRGAAHGATWFAAVRVQENRRRAARHHPGRLHSRETVRWPRSHRLRRRQPGRLVDLGREALPDLLTIDGELLPDGRVVPIEGEHIKPDMTAEVTISVDAVKTPVSPCPSRPSSAAPRWARSARYSSRRQLATTGAR